MKSKRCPSCGKDKILSDFIRSRNTKDGLGAYCKACHREKCRAFREKNPDKIRESRSRSNAKNPERIAREEANWRKSAIEWMKKYPQKKRAQTAVSNATRDGRLPKASTQLCARCGKRASHYHHPDYSKPLDVIPLCKSCHRAEHST